MTSCVDGGGEGGGGHQECQQIPNNPRSFLFYHDFIASGLGLGWRQGRFRFNPKLARLHTCSVDRMREARTTGHVGSGLLRRLFSLRHGRPTSGVVAYLAYK